MWFIFNSRINMYFINLNQDKVRKRDLLAEFTRYRFYMKGNKCETTNSSTQTGFVSIKAASQSKGPLFVKHASNIHVKEWLDFLHIFVFLQRFRWKDLYHSSVY